MEALIRQLEGLARQQPVVMIFEDAHWIDPTSRELVDLTVERVRSLPVLLAVTFRPEFQPPWTGLPQVTMLALNRLDRLDRTALVEQIAGGKLPDAVNLALGVTWLGRVTAARVEWFLHEADLPCFGASGGAT